MDASRVSGRSFELPVAIDRFELTRSDDGGGGLTTQLVVVTPAEGRR